MALNLHKQGHELVVWNRTRSKTEHLASLGVRVASDLQDAVAHARVVFLCLTGDLAVNGVVREALHDFMKGTVVVDHSTTSPDLAREMARLLSEKGVCFLDAPISGGVKGAKNAELVVMVGGGQDPFEQTRPLLMATCKHIFFLGPSGNGQTAKAVNQLLVAVNQAVVCEAMILAEESGLDLKLLYEVLVRSWGYSRMLERSVPDIIIPRNFRAGASKGVEYVLKDLNVVVELARSLGVKLPLTEITRGYYQKANEEGMGPLDHAAILDVIRGSSK
jgi:3-hydroxyisobutyrate dehydrogenase-like beta-hydroxyacid dehydrogenase